MEPTLSKATGVYFLAEAPDKDEDENSGKPLTGPSGKLLRSCIPDDEEEFCSFDNVVNCRPENNRTPVWTEIECCRPRRIKWIEQTKPKLIVGLGNIPLQWMLGSIDMSGMRGRLFAVKIGNHSCWFLPTYHPSFILRVAFDKKKPLQSKMGHCFRMDVEKAFRYLSIPKAPKVDTEIEARAAIQCFNGTGGLPALLGLLKRASEAPKASIDIETSTLRPYAGAKAKILSVAISFKDVNFAFAVDHPKSGWLTSERTQLLAALQHFLIAEVIKIAHNAPFEIEWFIHYFGVEIVRHELWECTMMQAHFLDERRGKQGTVNDDVTPHRAVYQSLDFLCKQHFGIAYKKLFNLPKKDMASADLAEMLTYNGVDSKYTLRLFIQQNELLSNEGLLDGYYEAIPRQPTVALMQHLGVPIEQKEIKKSQDLLKKEIDSITNEIYSLKVVKAFINDRKEFNPLSGPDTISIFRDYLKRKELEVKDKSGEVRVSVDKHVLDKIDHPLANLIITLRNKTKMKATYVDCFELGVGESIWPDGNIHTNFNTTFAVTGRLSSDQPNIQNWPHRSDPWVRRPVIPPKKHLLAAFDYGQLEGCTAAICSGDKVLIKALWEDYDIHMEWTERLVKRHHRFLEGSDTLLDKQTAKRYRSIVKNKLVFPAIFGASNPSISGYLNSPIEVIEDIMDDFWKMFDGLLQWQIALMKKYYNSGYVESLTGRRHYYPLTRNEAINMPIQCLACDIVCDSMNRLSYKAATSGEWHLHPRLNVHDDLTFFIPDNDQIIEESIVKIYTEMLTPPYKYVNVPLSVSASLGSNWFEPTEIGKFWSHKDV